MTPEVPQPSISERKRELLELVCLGYTNRAIAAQMCLSVGTVKMYLATLVRMVGDGFDRERSIRAQLGAWWMENRGRYQ